MHRFRLRAWALVLLLWPAVPLSSQAVDDKVAALIALRTLDARVATVGYRLAAANAAACPAPTPASGIVVHTLAQYGADYRESAVQAFALADGPAILAVVPGSAADRAGIRQDDRIVSIEGRPVASADPSGRRGAFGFTEQVSDAIDAALADGRADLQLTRGAAGVTARIVAAPACASRFQVVPSRSFSASADGRYVQMTAALALYASDDDELAAILAHELAHNILRHRVRLDDARVSRGIFKNFGRNARLIRETEVEADRVSVRLMAAAGYDPAAAARFWRRFGPEHGHGIFGSATHPGWRKRVVALDAEVTRLSAGTATDRPAAD